MSAVGGEQRKIEVRLKWDPSSWDEPPRHLDIVAAVCTAEEPYGAPAYVVHYDSRSPDGTITMQRDSRTGLGLGFVEVMVLELDRLSAVYGRVVVGVVIHQKPRPRTFADMSNAGVVVVEDYRELLSDDFAGVAGAAATTVAEFTRSAAGSWDMHEMIRGSQRDPESFMAEMGAVSRS